MMGLVSIWIYTVSRLVVGYELPLCESESTLLAKYFSHDEKLLIGRALIRDD